MTDDERTEFTRFYEQHRDACLRAVVARTGNRLIAEDLVAESFARAWANWPKVRNHPAPQAWVARTALNTNISWWRQRKREVPLVGIDGRASVDVEPLDPTLVRALGTLSSRQRDVFTLRILLDLDTETTAKVLGIASGTVGSHLSRAIASLRRQLSPPEAATTRLETA